MNNYIGQILKEGKFNTTKHQLIGENPRDALERYCSQNHWEDTATWLVTNVNNHAQYLLEIAPVIKTPMVANYVKSPK